jgi:hypothetical protein
MTLWCRTNFEHPPEEKAKKAIVGGVVAVKQL